MADILCNNLEVIRFINTPVPSNAFLVVSKEHKRCIVIDPGSKDQADIRDYICENGYSLDYIVLTHEHFDHCWGVNSLLSVFDAKVVASEMCSRKIKKPQNYFNKLYYNSDTYYSINHVDVIVEHINMQLRWCDTNIYFIDAKGHTSSGICISIGMGLFSGDTMIYNTKPFLKKRYGASVEDLRQTIDNIYESFNTTTTVFPGHGDSFSLGDMKLFYNQYFKKI
ncbi:MAG: MBL fold metallo-hydrolase [Bacteroides sp.]